MAGKRGLFIVGIKGMTGSAVAAGLSLMAGGDIPEIYGVTSTPFFPSIDLTSAADWVIAGWDVSPLSLVDSCTQYGWFSAKGKAMTSLLTEIPVWRGLYGDLDWARRCDPTQATRFISLADGAEAIRERLAGFMKEHGLSGGVLVYLGAPHERWQPESLVWQDGLLPSESCPAALCYAVGAVMANVHFVDCTPSATLQNTSLVDAALRQSVRLAGRDLSTGQTMVKAAIFEVLGRRNLFPEAWFSTNLIGNNDGRVLSDPSFAELKLTDKLAALTGAGDEIDKRCEHHVDINFMRSWGDDKEAWDAGSYKAWGDGRGLELRINWRGPDSFLAAPMVLDLARLISAEDRGLPAGLQEHLAFFFKWPLGMEDSLLSQRWERLVSSYEQPL